MYLFLTILLVWSSVLVYSYFKLYWVSRFNGSGDVIGFRVYSAYRNLYVFTNTLAGFLVILLYEFVAQVYYHTHLLQEKSKETKYKIVSYIILCLSVLSIAIWILAGRNITTIVILRQVIMAQVIILLSIAIHLLFFHKVFPFFTKIGKTAFERIAYRSLGFFGYLLMNLLISTLFINMLPEVKLFVFSYLIANILGIITAVIRWYFFVENRQLKTQVFQKSAELSTLRSQINPHFLFNALNTLYAVALKENAEKTANGIQKLGDMMRFMLHENHQDRIPLSKEIEYLQNFIEIQRMRIDESQNIEIRINLQEPEREIYLAPMLLNPFVENAFKHGISFRNPSWIYITLTLDSQKIYFKVHNSLHSKLESDPEENKSGVGLENVKKRLDLIYP
ncbi:MAG: histidine kinase, partial [Verrucomicrobia bacterium]|nr:histidine kinase [Cytophagales bacterium]